MELSANAHQINKAEPRDTQYFAALFFIFKKIILLLEKRPWI